MVVPPARVAAQDFEARDLHRRSPMARGSQPSITIPGLRRIRSRLGVRTWSQFPCRGVPETSGSEGKRLIILVFLAEFAALMRIFPCRQGNWSSRARSRSASGLYPRTRRHHGRAGAAAEIAPSNHRSAQEGNHGDEQQNPRRHRRGQSAARVCLDCPYPGLAGASRIRNHRTVHDAAGIGRCGRPALRDSASVFGSGKARATSRCRPGHGQRQGARSLPAGHGGDRGRQACLLRMAARPRHRRGRPDARCRRTQRNPARGRAARPDVAGDQLCQGSGCRRLCRPGPGGDDDRLRAELGSLDRPRLPGRSGQRRQPA